MLGKREETHCYPIYIAHLSIALTRETWREIPRVLFWTLQTLMST
jgi:hypothetical protein